MIKNQKIQKILKEKFNICLEWIILRLIEKKSEKANDFIDLAYGLKRKL